MSLNFITKMGFLGLWNFGNLVWDVQFFRLWYFLFPHELYNLVTLLLFKKIFLNWRIIALQCCVDFCPTTRSDLATPNSSQTTNQALSGHLLIPFPLSETFFSPIILILTGSPLGPFIFKNQLKHLYFVIQIFYDLKLLFVAKSCLTLCKLMDCSTPGFPVLCLLEFAQIHVHSVSNSFYSSHPLMPPSPFAFSFY